MGKGVFVTGTDTDVGKTIVTAGLASLLINDGFDIGVMKPIETGCPKRKGRLFPRDAVFLRAASGSKDRLSLINPYRFSKPLAPLIAAAIDHKEIKMGKISLAYEKLKKKHDVTFVEGAGGLLVPLTPRLTNLDLILKLALPLLVVVSSKLGAVNHALLTVNWARKNGIKVIGFVINLPTPNRLNPRKNLAQKTNPMLIRSFAGVPILGEVPYIPLIYRPHAFSKWAVMNLLRRTIDLEKIKAQIF
jgi:dethiobiotin synthetase